MKLEEISKRIQAAQEKRKQLAKEKESAAAEAERLKGEADAAAERGDVDEYLRLKGLLDRAEGTAFVKGRQLEKDDSPVSEDELREGWADYVRGYGTKLTAAQVAYDKAKTATAAAFRKMVDLQHEACVQREELAKIAGIPKERFGKPSVEMERLFGMPYIPTPGGVNSMSATVGQLGTVDFDLLFFISSMGHTSMTELCSDPAVTSLLRELRSHLT